MGTGWKVDLDGSAGRLRGVARKVVGGTVLGVSAEGATVDDLAWRLVEAAATELESAADAQSAAVAA
jgi:hypothetical protein